MENVAKMKVYIIGHIVNTKKNKRHFNHLAEMLTRQGYSVLNPHVLYFERGLSRAAMIDNMKCCRAVYFDDEWQDDIHSCIEGKIANELLINKIYGSKLNKTIIA